MTTIIIEFYDALRSINVPEEKAPAAARSVSITSMDIALMRSEFAQIRSKLLVLEWMLAASLVMTFAIFLKVCEH